MTDAREFENILGVAVAQLNTEVRNGTLIYDPEGFARRVMQVVKDAATGRGVTVEPTFHPHAFPDIHVNSFGIEVKATNQPSWLSVGNSVFEGMRDPRVREVYVVFGRFGGASPAVRWERYEDCVTHVRVSHAPRFVIEMGDGKTHPPLFRGMGVDYQAFAALSADDKMRHIRAYTRGRLGRNETIWWLDGAPDREESSRPAATQPYWSLGRETKDKLRAEAAILCPEIVAPPRTYGKYDRAALYMLTRYNVLCANARDAFTAGSVSTPGGERGGQYLLRALKLLQQQMLDAAASLPDRLVESYWEIDVPPERRIAWWLAKADEYAPKNGASAWTPSGELFQRVEGEGN